jgi:hypothetical protein
VALVANLIEPKYKATVIRTLVSGISNLTNQTMSEESLDKKRLTVARSLSQVSNLIRSDPEIITNKEKEAIKGVLNTLIKIDDTDNDFYASGRSLSSNEVYLNRTEKT